MGGTEINKVREAMNQALTTDSIHPDDIQSLHLATQAVIKKLQETSRIWLQLTEDCWSNDYQRYRAVFNTVKQSFTPPDQPKKILGKRSTRNSQVAEQTFSQDSALTFADKVAETPQNAEFPQNDETVTDYEEGHSVNSENAMNTDQYIMKQKMSVLD